MDFQAIYEGIGRWCGSEDETARNKDAAVAALYELSYGLQMPLLKPYWRKREDTITPVDGTQKYIFPTTNGSFESFHQFWYTTTGSSRRSSIEIVDDVQWARFSNENTANTGFPNIVNQFSDAGTLKLRFSPTPSGSFITQATLIRLDGFIIDPITAASGDTAEPLMPDSRRQGIVWRGVELMAARQGDRQLIEWARSEGKRYYELIYADDVTRTGNRTRVIKPIERQNLSHGHHGQHGHDYGFRHHAHHGGGW